MGPPTTWRCASWPKTPGSGSPRCGRPCPTNACRCCCAVATPSAIPPTRPQSPRRSSPRPPKWASTSSVSSTHSTTSSNCDRRSMRCLAMAVRSPKLRCATAGTCSTRPKTCTPRTTTCGWPSSWSRPGRIRSRSRTWPGCCAPTPPRSWSPRCVRTSICPCRCTPTTQPAARSAPCWRPSRQVPTRSTWPVPRCRRPPRSRG